MSVTAGLYQPSNVRPFWQRTDGKSSWRCVAPPSTSVLMPVAKAVDGTVTPRHDGGSPNIPSDGGTNTRARFACSLGPVLG